MHYLYSYLIAGFLCAIWNDITISRNITEKHYNDKSTLFKIFARFCVVISITIFWLPATLYVLITMKVNSK